MHNIPHECKWKVEMTAVKWQMRPRPNGRGGEEMKSRNNCWCYVAAGNVAAAISSRALLHSDAHNKNLNLFRTTVSCGSVGEAPFADCQHQTTMEEVPTETAKRVKSNKKLCEASSKKVLTRCARMQSGKQVRTLALREVQHISLLPPNYQVHVFCPSHQLGSSSRSQKYEAS